jgi:integrase
MISVPATPDGVAAFVDSLSGVKSTATIRRYVSSIATLHRAAQVPNPCDALVVKLALKRVHRAKGRAQTQVAPLNRRSVDKMLTAGGDGIRDLRNRAILAVAYDTLCRRSELVGLQVEDIEAGTDGTGTVIVRRSKTDRLTLRVGA